MPSLDGSMKSRYSGEIQIPGTYNTLDEPDSGPRREDIL